MAVNITRAVSGKLTYYTLTRNGNEFKMEWKIPDYMTDENRNDRMTWEDMEIIFNGTNMTTSYTEIWGTTAEPGNKTLAYTAADKFWVRGLEIGGLKTDVTKPYDRKRYYPLTNRKCTSVYTEVHGGNGVTGYYDEGGTDFRQGVWGRGPKAEATYTFEAPAPVEIELSWGDDQGLVVINVAIDAAPDSVRITENQERYDTMWRVLRQDNIPGSGYASKKVLKNWESSQNEEIETTFPTNAVNVKQLAEGQWIEYTVEAYSRGMRGDGPVKTKTITAVRPARYAIKSISVSSMDMVTGIVMINTNRIAQNSRIAVTKANLQRLKNVDQKLTAQEVARQSGWEDVSSMEIADTRNNAAAQLTGFIDDLANAYPNENRKTWYRVVTENDLYFGNTSTYSTPVEATALFHAATAEDDFVKIEGLSTNEDASAIRVQLGWENDDSTGTELSWSKHADAWESSEPPSTAEVTWKDPVSQGDYPNSAGFTIYGIEDGEAYHIKARRYRDGESQEERTYGEYATAIESLYPYKPTLPPTDVTLNAPSYIARDSDLAVSWTFQSPNEQEAWILYQIVTEEGSDIRKPLASGEDSFGGCVVPAASISGDSIRLQVSMTTGNDWADSDISEVIVSDPPVIKAIVTTPVRVQPLIVYASSTTGNDTLVVKIFSLGISVDGPDRTLDQYYGDVVWSAVTNPEWMINDQDGLYYTAVTLPEGLDFYDLGYYRLSVTAVNNLTGLTSTEQVMDFRIQWLHQATVPENPVLVVDQEGKTVSISVDSPENYEEGDVFDVYRMTPDGAYKVAESMEYGSKVLDRYAPYSKIAELSYRIVNRTTDGDFTWIDVPYVLKSYFMRFDWGVNQYVELPYNLKQNDSYTKDAEIRAHLDGTRSGYWNKNVSRKASLNTDLVKLSDPQQLELIRDMGRHPGAVFVRTPDGSAFQANVNVSGIDRSYDSLVLAASFDAEEVRMTGEFMVQPNDVDYPSGGDETAPEVVYSRSKILRWSTNPPIAEDQFEMADTPYGTFSVTMQSSYDRYMTSYRIDDVTFSDSSIVINSLSENVRNYISDAELDGTHQYLITINYNVKPEEEENQNG